MAKHITQLQCIETDCKERSFYESATRAEQRQAECRAEGWHCVRHARPAEVLTSDRRLITYEVVSQRGTIGLYWNGFGFLYGPGFKVYPDDFPEGTMLRVTAEVILPEDAPNKE